MFDGSLIETRWEAVVTFMVMIVLADEHGVVDMTPAAISGRTTIPKEIIEAGVEALEAPDPNSRTLADTADDGRRLIRIDDHRPWGWQIVNYEKYRNARDKNALRAHWREQYHRRKEASG